MSRSLTTTLRLASEASQCITAIFVRMDFSGGIFRANSTPYTYTFGGEEYIGVGNLGQISELNESSDIEVSGISLQLSGIDPAIMSLALGEVYQNRDAIIYLGFLDSDHALKDDPMIFYRGRMDTMEIEIGETATISVNIKNRFADWKKPRISRFTNEEQQMLYPNDKGFEFVPQMLEKQLPWGVIDPEVKANNKR